MQPTWLFTAEIAGTMAIPGIVVTAGIYISGCLIITFLFVAILTINPTFCRFTDYDTQTHKYNLVVLCIYDIFV